MSFRMIKHVCTSLVSLSLLTVSSLSLSSGMVPLTLTAIKKEMKKTVLTKFDLDPNKTPSENFDLKDWYLSVPVDNDGNGFADSIKGADLDGYTSEKYFYTASDGGMVFRSPVGGQRTSKNTRFSRVELREVLSRGGSNKTKDLKNNWVFSTTPQAYQDKAGGVDGYMRATLAVNKVTETGLAKESGRIIVGQIHAVVDEPLRLYYRKTPKNSKGTLYLVHEPERNSGKEEVYMVFYGDSHKSGMSNPVDGIELDEKFTYEVRVIGHQLSVTIIRDGRKNITKTVDMSHSGYDKSGQYMYFKAGLYNQNSTGEPDDYAQVTFYELLNRHKKYKDDR